MLVQSNVYDYTATMSHNGSMIALASANWSFQGNTHMVLELGVAGAIVGQIAVCRQILNAPFSQKSLCVPH